MDIIADKKVRIRKARKCQGCLRKFQPGAKMNRQTLVEYREIWNFYTCPACQIILDGTSFYGEPVEEGFAKEIMADEGFTGTIEEFVFQQWGKVVNYE